MQKLSKKNLIACNYCHGNKVRKVFDSIQFSVVKCVRCGLVYLSPRPDLLQIKKYYTLEYFSNNEKGIGYRDYKGLNSDLEKEAVRRLKIIKNKTSSGNLLDVGCGYGEFLLAASDSGFKVTGCDIIPDSVQYIRKQYHLNTFVCDMEQNNLPPGNYDIITAWDVIEHMTDPASVLQKFHQSLKKNAWLFMTTPNIESIDAKILKKHWYGFKKIPEHLYFFSPKSIKDMLEKTGFRNVGIINWGFQRNIGFCIDQLADYSKSMYRIIKPIINWANLYQKSLFFPFIDMFVYAEK